MKYFAILFKKNILNFISKILIQSTFQLLLEQHEQSFDFAPQYFIISLYFFICKYPPEFQLNLVFILYNIKILFQILTLKILFFS